MFINFFFFIFQACGFTTVLRHGQSVVVTSPTIHGHYQANVFCKWNIISSQSLWYKVNNHKFRVVFFNFNILNIITSVQNLARFHLKIEIIFKKLLMKSVFVNQLFFNTNKPKCMSTNIEKKC